MDQVEVRIATNEAIFRRVNDEIAASPGRFTEADFVCECGEPDCHEQVTIALDRYKEIRSDDLVFFVLPGHEAPKAETVVERWDGYLLVKKGEETRPVLDQFE